VSGAVEVDLNAAVEDARSLSFLVSVTLESYCAVLTHLDLCRHRGSAIIVCSNPRFDSKHKKTLYSSFIMVSSFYIGTSDTQSLVRCSVKRSTTNTSPFTHETLTHPKRPPLLLFSLRTACISRS
jgi:hypothetical protein